MVSYGNHHISIIQRSLDLNDFAEDGDLRGQPERLGCGRGLRLHRGGDLFDAERWGNTKMWKNQLFDVGISYKLNGSS